MDAFVKLMLPPNLSYRQPTTMNQLWVFWNQEDQEEEEEEENCPHTHQIVSLNSSSSSSSSSCGLGTLTNNNNKKWRNVVNEYLKSELCNAEYTEGPNILVQLWVPTTTLGGSCVLTPLNQPFGLKRIERGLCEYRKHCMGLQFNVFQDDDDHECGSLISRVFRHKQVEFTAAWQSGTTKNHPPHNFAHTYGIKRCLVLPFFKPSGRCCAGVLELVDTIPYRFFGGLHHLAKAIFKGGNLINQAAFKLQESTEDRVLDDEINKALEVVCTTHMLPLAQIWIPCCSGAAMDYVNSPDKSCCCYSPYLCCSDRFSSSISQNGDAYIYRQMKNFNLFCSDHTFRKGRGVVGKTLLYHKPFFCGDVTQFPIAEYPLSHSAREYGLTACYAICLHRTTGTKNHDYVLEFFLPLWNTFSGDPKTLELLLVTVKNELPGFKICSGEELCAEVRKISMNDEQDSFIMSQTTSVQPIPESFASEREVMQNKVVNETVRDNGLNILGLKQNDIVVSYSEKTMGPEFFGEAAKNDEITTAIPPLPESLQNETEVVQLSDQSAEEEAVTKNEVNFPIAKQKRVALTSLERISSRAGASKEREYRTTDISLSRDDLVRHFGKKLDHAAQCLGVSRSTMKRACRKHKINKWPAPKRKKVNPSTSNLKHMREVVRSGNDRIEGTDKGDPSCSKPPPMSATPAIPHKISNATPREQVVGTVTVKATYGVDTLRFQLPFSSRKTDLVEKVTQRLSLNEGSFNIKYEDEDGDWVLIACDEDLEECIGILKGKNKIKMLVQPIQNQTP